MEVLTIDTNESTIRFNPQLSGAIEIVVGNHGKNMKGYKAHHIQAERVVAVIPKESRAQLANFLVTGKVEAEQVA